MVVEQLMAMAGVNAADRHASGDASRRIPLNRSRRCRHPDIGGSSDTRAASDPDTDHAPEGCQAPQSRAASFQRPEKTCRAGKQRRSKYRGVRSPDATIVETSACARTLRARGPVKSLDRISGSIQRVLSATSPSKNGTNVWSSCHLGYNSHGAKDEDQACPQHCTSRCPRNAGHCPGARHRSGCARRRGQGGRRLAHWAP